MKEVVVEFNSFFVNVGPNLAKTIKQHNNGQAEGGWNGESEVLQSIFLGEVKESEIISIVTKFKNKTSTESDGIDMTIV